MKTRLGVLLAATSALAGCGGSDTFNVYVPDKWNEAIRRFDLAPIYPAREDIYPGDVIFTDGLKKRSDGSGLDWMTVAAHASDVPDILARYYKERPMISGPPIKPATTEAAAGDKPTKPDPKAAKKVPDPIASETNETIYRHDAVRVTLRNLAVPSLDVGKFRVATLGASGRAGGANISGGFSDSASQVVSVSLDGLKSLAVDRQAFMDAMEQQEIQFLVRQVSPNRLVKFLSERDRAVAAEACEMRLPDLDRRKLNFTIVNEVIYAHSISYTYHGDHTFAAQLSAQVTSAAGAALAKTAPPSSGSAQSTPDKSTPDKSAPDKQAAASDTTATPSPADLARERTLAAMQALAKSVPDTGVPGSVQVSFGASSSGELSLIKSFVRPLAIGYAGSTSYSPSELIRAYRWLYEYLRNPQVPAAFKDPRATQMLDNALFDMRGVCKIYGANPDPLYRYVTTGNSN